MLHYVCAISPISLSVIYSYSPHLSIFFHNFVKPCGGDSLRHGIPSTSEKQKEQISYGVITHTYLSHALSPFLSLSIIDEPSVAGNRLAERDSLQSL